MQRKIKDSKARAATPLQNRANKQLIKETTTTTNIFSIGCFSTTRK